MLCNAASTSPSASASAPCSTASTSQRSSIASCNNAQCCSRCSRRFAHASAKTATRRPPALSTQPAEPTASPDGTISTEMSVLGMRTRWPGHMPSHAATRALTSAACLLRDDASSRARPSAGSEISTQPQKSRCEITADSANRSSCEHSSTASTSAAGSVVTGLGIPAHRAGRAPPTMINASHHAMTTAVSTPGTGSMCNSSMLNTVAVAGGGMPCVNGKTRLSPLDESQ